MSASDICVDRLREVPAIPQTGFPGMTELSAGGRCVQICATGPAARAALVRHVEAAFAAERAAPLAAAANDDRSATL
jgi:hypothetical protein